MCLITFNWQNHPKYKLILLANRDEFYQRKTQAAHFWEDNNLLAGKDLEAGGTWMGVHKNGKFSALTNYRDLQNIKPVAPSRGHLVSDFLLNDSKPIDYLEKITPLAQDYNGFNLLLGDMEELYYFSNYENKIHRLEKGLYGLSNHLLDTDWYKVKQAKAKLAQAIQDNDLIINDLLNLMHDIRQPEDNQVQQTGLSMDKERMLSPMFIESPEYGTCSSSVLLIDWQNQVNFTERVYNTQDKKIKEQTFEFNVLTT